MSLSFAECLRTSTTGGAIRERGASSSYEDALGAV